MSNVIMNTESPIRAEPEAKEFKPLDTQFTENEALYTQIRRCGNVALYHRRRSGKVNWEDFEVIRIRSQKAGVSFRKNGEETVKVEFEAKELYPSDNQWGDFGWTFQTEEAAVVKFQEVLNRPVLPVGKSKKATLNASEGQDSGSESGGLLA